jgi:hypothetical protein
MKFIVKFTKSDYANFSLAINYTLIQTIRAEIGLPNYPIDLINMDNASQGYLNTNMSNMQWGYIPDMQVDSIGHHLTSETVSVRVDNRVVKQHCKLVLVKDISSTGNVNRVHALYKLDIDDMVQSWIKADCPLDWTFETETVAN